MSLGEQSFFWQYPEVPLTEEENEYYQVNGQEMCSIFESMFTTGISPEFIVRSAADTPKNYIGSSLAVSAGEGLNVIVSPGSAMIKGHPYLASLPINIGVAEGITDILLQMNTTTDKPFISLVSRPRSGGNIEDNVKREALIYELAIATIEVPIGAIAVTPVMIKDHRLNMTLSTINKQPIAGLMQPKPNVGTLGIWEDWNKLDDYIKKSWADFIKQSTEAWATYISGKNAEWEQIKTNVNGEFDSLTSQFNTQITTNQSNFERWFSTLQTMLDGDVAAELAGKVAKLQADKANKSDVYTKPEIDTKLTETNKSITAIKSTTYTKSQTDTLIASRTGVNASASRPWGDNPEIVLIENVPVGVTHITFVASSDFKQSDVYCILYANASNAWNDKIKLTITDLAGEPLDDGIWKTGAPVSLIIQGDKAFFKGGGGGVNDTLPFLASFKATAKNGLIHLDLSAENNQLPVFLGTTLVRKIGSAPVNFRDGIKIEIGGAGSYDDTNVENGVTYYYRAFPYNSKKQHQTTTLNAVVSATPKAGTPLKDLPIGTLVVDPNTKYYNQPIIWKIADQNHSGYPTNSTTLISDKILAIGFFDAREPNNENEYRSRYGNNRYQYSNIRQMLNSDKGASNWYTPSHPTDSPPSSEYCYEGYNPYDIKPGFLNAFSQRFKSSILLTTLYVEKSKVDGGGLEEVRDKVFLLSGSEAGLSKENNIPEENVAEGSRLALFANNDNLTAYPTIQAVENSNYANPYLSSSQPWSWGLRTPRLDNPHGHYKIVSNEKRVVSINAEYGIDGIRPLCNLPNDTYVNPVPNSEGSYNIIF